MTKAAFKELIQMVLFHLSKRIMRSRKRIVETEILFFNTMWGQPFGLDDIDLPSGFKLTTDKWRFNQADAVVFHIPNLYWINNLQKRPGQIWIAWSMECDVNYSNLCNLKFMKRFDLTMTYRLDSDVPYSYSLFYGSAENLKHHLVKPLIEKKKKNLAALFISSSHDKNGRLQLSRTLMNYIEIHSYGKCLNNRRLENDDWRPTKLDVIAGYKFTMAFENVCALDYVTEKFYDPLIVNSVPVYLGAPNIDKFVPGEKCFINVADFDSPKALAEHLLELDADKEAYLEYLNWKQKPLRAEFIRFLDDQKLHPFVRLCHKIKEVKRA